MAHSILECVYRPGFVYHKAGVFLTDIMPKSERPQSVLVRIDDERRLQAMYAVDEINRRHGRYSVRSISLVAGRGWDMRQQKVSPHHIARIDEVPRVKAR